MKKESAMFKNRMCIFIIITLHRVIIVIKRRTTEMAGSYNTYSEYNECNEVMVGKSERKILFERPRHKWNIILKWFLKRCDVSMSTGLISLRI
jgi:hypothetical protein